MPDIHVQQTERVHQPNTRRTTTTAFIRPHELGFHRWLYCPFLWNASHGGHVRCLRDRRQHHTNGYASRWRHGSPRIHRRSFPFLSPNLSEPARMWEQAIQHSWHIVRTSERERIYVGHFDSKWRRFRLRKVWRSVVTERNALSLFLQRRFTQVCLPHASSRTASSAVARPNFLERFLGCCYEHQ